MRRKIDKEIAFSVFMLVALAAVFVIWSMDQKNKQGMSILQPKVNIQNSSAPTKPKEKSAGSSFTRTIEGSYSFKAYGIETSLSIPADIVGNDYRDGLIQFVIKQRATNDKMIAYDGGLPFVGIRISKSCNGQDITGMCEQFSRIPNDNSLDWVVRKNDKDEVLSVKRKNLYTKGEDFFDSYYIKKEDKIISLNYEYTPHEIYVIEGIDKKNLPKLPNKTEEEKVMKEFMENLVEQFEKSAQ